MRTVWGSALLLTLAAPLAAPAAEAAMVKCALTFELHEWAAVYESATGTGKITCDNGQSAPVAIRSKGGGLSAGKFTIKDGRGSFSDVANIDELFGRYAAADSSAGARKAADAWVMTKDKVSLGISGTGKGWDLGFTVDEFTISKAKISKAK